jgi:integrase
VAHAAAGKHLDPMKEEVFDVSRGGHWGPERRVRSEVGVAGKGGKTRAVPIEGGLEEVLEAYLATRQARFERDDLDHPATPLFVDVRGQGLPVHQVKYLDRAALRPRWAASPGAGRGVGARPAPQRRLLGPGGRC